jgi:hypothetical protein
LQEVHYDEFFDPPEGHDGPPLKKRKVPGKDMEQEGSGDDEMGEEEEEAGGDDDKEELVYSTTLCTCIFSYECSRSLEGEDMTQIFGGERGKAQEELSTFEKRQDRVC